jgi:SOS-response transcriptional repressor LexA
MDECLDFLIAQETAGKSPSMDEIAIAIGLVSKSNVHRILHALKARGLVDWQPHIARSIRLVACNPAYTPEALSKLRPIDLYRLYENVRDALNP